MCLLKHSRIGASQAQNVTIAQNHGIIQDILAQRVGLAASKALTLLQRLLHLFTLQMVIHSLGHRIIIKKHLTLGVEQCYPVRQLHSL